MAAEPYFAPIQLPLAGFCMTDPEALEGAARHDLDHPLILIVDDEPIALEIADLALRRKGFETTTARGGREGWEKVQKLQPQLVLLDITMPDMDGFDVFRLIRETERFQRLPVIFVTARDDEEHKMKGLQLGATDYITKPYSPNELVARVRNTLQLLKLEQEAREHESQQARRRLLEEMLITLSHYINNAVAAIKGYTEITREENPESVRKLKGVVLRQTEVISSTLKTIESMHNEMKLGTAHYVDENASMLDIETELKRRIQQKLDELEGRGGNG